MTTSPVAHALRGNPSPPHLDLDWAGALREIAGTENYHACTVGAHAAPHVVTDPAVLTRVAAAFPVKYPWWHPTVRDGEFFAEETSAPRTVFAARPRNVFGFGKARAGSAARDGRSLREQIGGDPRRASRTRDVRGARPAGAARAGHAKPVPSVPTSATATARALASGQA